MRAGDSPAHSVTRDDARAAKSPAATAAQRQRAYRLRRKRAEIEAIGEEADASRVTLLALLGRDLAALDSSTTAAPMFEAKRNSAQRVLKAIVTRYGIEL